jgi:hypothetical protein
MVPLLQCYNYEYIIIALLIFDMLFKPMNGWMHVAWAVAGVVAIWSSYASFCPLCMMNSE